MTSSRTSSVAQTYLQYLACLKLSLSDSMTKRETTSWNCSRMHAIVSTGKTQSSLNPSVSKPLRWLLQLKSLAEYMVGWQESFRERNNRQLTHKIRSQMLSKIWVR